MMYQVKILEAKTAQTLEKRINVYLGKMARGSEVLSITYTLRGINPKAVVVFKSVSKSRVAKFSREEFQKAEVFMQKNYEACSQMKSNPFI